MLNGEMSVEKGLREKGKSGFLHSNLGGGKLSATFEGKMRDWKCC